MLVMLAVACDAGGDNSKAARSPGTPVVPSMTPSVSLTPEPTPSLPRDEPTTITSTPPAPPGTATPPAPPAPTATASPTMGPTGAPAVACGITPSDEAQAAAWVAGLSTEQKVGALIFAGLPAPVLDDQWSAFIRDHSLANFAPLGRNLVDPDQMRAFRAALDEAVVEAGLPYGALLAADQEGGIVARLNSGNGFPDLPGAAAVGATGDTALARELGGAFAGFLVSVGISVDFAPDLDVNDVPGNPVIGPRAFGDDPGLVAEMGTALIEGLQCGGVAAIGKHFPGHGSTTLDSHIAFPTVTKTPEEIARTQLPPFEAAIGVGVAGVMTAHVAYPNLDGGEVPATVSEPIITGLLREQLGFGGLVISDDFGMAGILGQFGAGEAAVLAVTAGVDAIIALNRHRPDLRERPGVDEVAQPLADEHAAGPSLPVESQLRGRVTALAGGEMPARRVLFPR